MGDRRLHRPIFDGQSLVPRLARCLARSEDVRCLARQVRNIKKGDVVDIQSQEHICLEFEGKVSGPFIETSAVDTEFDYRDYFGVENRGL